MVRSPSEIEALVRKTIAFVNKRCPVKEAYLFGSYAEGCAKETSDIDVAVFADDVEKLNIEERMDIICNVQKEICADIELHLYPSSKMSEIRPSNFMGYIANHGKKIAA